MGNVLGGPFRLRCEALPHPPDLCIQDETLPWQRLNPISEDRGGFRNLSAIRTGFFDREYRRILSRHVQEELRRREQN
jgi:hypothetical protein